MSDWQLEAAQDHICRLDAQIEKLEETTQDLLEYCECVLEVAKAYPVGIVHFHRMDRRHTDVDLSLFTDHTVKLIRRHWPGVVANGRPVYLQSLDKRIKPPVELKNILAKVLTATSD